MVEGCDSKSKIEDLLQENLKTNNKIMEEETVFQD